MNRDKEADSETEYGQKLLRTVERNIKGVIDLVADALKVV